MTRNDDIPEQLTILIENLSKAPTATTSHLGEALLGFLLDLHHEKILSRSDYGLLCHSLETAFWNESCEVSDGPIELSDLLLRAEEAVELIERIKELENEENEDVKASLECDIGAFINHVNHEVQHGAAEKVELEFYRNWLDRILF